MIEEPQQVPDQKDQDQVGFPDGGSPVFPLQKDVLS